MKLRDSDRIWKLAKDLGIKPTSNPVSDILLYCEKRVTNFLKGANCKTLQELLNWIGSQLGTSFEEIHSDDDLREIKAKYIRTGEKSFAILETWLTDDVCGITIKRTANEDWEPQYVSIIDCRGWKGKKAYYTKWHELGHLLILTEQMRLCYMRTLHLPDKDPEEQMVDIIAGRFGFYPPLIHPYTHNKISFDEIERIKDSLCPDASYQSTLIGFVNAWPKPCILLQCRPGLKANQKKSLVNHSFPFVDIPAPELRAVNSTSNQAAKDADLSIFKNMRVPQNSIINAVHLNETDYGKASEDLSWWESSDGTVLGSRKVQVECKRVGDDVYALITPHK